MRRALRHAASSWAAGLAPRAAAPAAPAWAELLAAGGFRGAWPAGNAGAARTLHASAADFAGRGRRAPNEPGGSAGDMATRPGADPQGRLLNAEITARQVRLVRPDGTHAVLRRDLALAEAREAKLDLVQVDGVSSPPVCRLLDWAHLRAEERLREKEQRQKAVVRRRSDVVKEVRLSLRTQEHDLRVKAAAAARALEEGHRAKCTVLFAARPGPNGRDGAGDPQARKQAEALLEAIQVAIQAEAGGPDAPPLAKVEQAPKVDGTVSMYCRLVPAAKAKAGKSVKASSAPAEEREERPAKKEAQPPKEPRELSEDEKLARLEATVIMVSRQIAKPASK